MIRIIHEWCETHVLPCLGVANVKGIAMSKLSDDRAIRVVPNTGEPAAELSAACLERAAAALAGMLGMSDAAVQNIASSCPENRGAQQTATV